MDSSIVSDRSIRRTLQKYWKGDVTKQSVNDISKECNGIVNEVIKAKVKVFDDFNTRRNTQGLPKLKRFDVTLLKKILHRLNKVDTSFNVGELGDLNRNTSFSEADEMDGFNNA